MSDAKEHDGVLQLESWLREAGCESSQQALRALPTTRALGKRFMISHVTVARSLSRLATAGVLWQHPGGRYYPAFARKVLGRPKPFAVLLRRMDSWSGLCREVMEGFEGACADEEHPLLLLHLKHLLVEPMPGRIGKVASTERQAEFLREIVMRYGDDVGGYFVDELWRNAALELELPKGVRIVTFYRDGGSNRVKAISVDHRASAMLALGHLLACRYDRIQILNLYRDYLPAKAFLDAATSVYGQLLGRAWDPQDTIPAVTEDDLDKLVQRLKDPGTPRTGLICPEDNNALALAKRLEEAGIELGKQHGLISTMGTGVIEHSGITTIRHSFVALGRSCAQYLLDGSDVQPDCTPRLIQGTSTTLP